ncbi:pyridine nucleotide-disulfide oxidoreductase [Candidatus Kaiserbacteria bacterium]|nr:pyridine nucleotide-disulfide oxidoreductase [Candidatus Kaiserbacteria bacterium]
MYDLAIIGGGPAGVAAGVYAARKRLNTVFIAEAVGGQSVDSQDVQNWIGTPHIKGLEMAKQLEKHLREYASDVLDIKLGERASKVESAGDHFSIQTTGSIYPAKTVLVATGGSRKKLEAKGAAEFENKGVTYCASCDGPLFTGQDVAVVGGGNAGFETAAQLLAYCKSVTLIHRREEFLRADKATVDAVLAHPNMRVLTPHTPVEVKGEQFVKSIVTKNVETGETVETPVAGIFVEIGMIPATELVSGLVALDEWGKIKVDGKTQRTSVAGIWAAGDCSDGLYHQNNIAAGDAVKALEDIYFFLKAAK